MENIYLNLFYLVRRRRHQINVFNVKNQSLLQHCDIFLLISNAQLILRQKLPQMAVLDCKLYFFKMLNIYQRVMHFVILQCRTYIMFVDNMCQYHFQSFFADNVDCSFECTNMYFTMELLNLCSQYSEHWIRALRLFYECANA